MQLFLLYLFSSISHSYSAWGAYGNSKMANLLFTFELNKRLAATANARNLTSVALHPGYTATNLQVFQRRMNVFYMVTRNC